MKKNKELAILFKKIVDINKNIEFVPIKVIEGTYCHEDNCFIDKDGTPYYHIIENPDSYGYSNRDSILNYKNSYRHLSLPLIKMLELREAKKYTYSYNMDGETEAPIILFTKPTNLDKIAILKDDDIEKFYKEKFPKFYSAYIDVNHDSNKEPENEEKEELDIKKLYQELTSQVIDQDEAIKKVLSVIWKQIGNENNKTKSIIIAGNSKVGKSEIFKILSQKLNIPINTISARDYTINRKQYKSTEQIIIELLTKANYNIEIAQKGILIIDKFEEVLNGNVPLGVINELEKLLEGPNILVNTNIGSFEFDTSKLIIIALNNTQKQKKENKKGLK